MPRCMELDLLRSLTNSLTCSNLGGIGTGILDNVNRRE